jgi:hypothetical protein
MAAAAGKTGTGAGRTAAGKLPAARFSAARPPDVTAAGEPGGESSAERHDQLAIPPPGVNAPGEDLRPPAVRAADENLAPRTPEQIASVMDPQEWACRSQEHSWPQLVPGADEIPKGMRISAAGRGNVLFEEDCLHYCGRYRETLTQQGWVVVWRRYGTRPGYRHTVVHRDEAMTKSSMREHTLSSNEELITKAVEKSATETRAAVAAAETTAAEAAES